jgi:hypothetical protein
LPVGFQYFLIRLFKGQSEEFRDIAEQLGELEGLRDDVKELNEMVADLAERARRYVWWGGGGRLSALWPR